MKKGVLSSKRFRLLIFSNAGFRVEGLGYLTRLNGIQLTVAFKQLQQLPPDFLTAHAAKTIIIVAPGENYEEALRKYVEGEKVKIVRTMEEATALSLRLSKDGTRYVIAETEG
ncbi:MAG: hypothetical protein WAW90_01845 [Minisyncoccia bacterium]